MMIVLLLNKRLRRDRHGDDLGKQVGFLSHDQIVGKLFAASLGGVYSGVTEDDGVANVELSRALRAKGNNSATAAFAHGRIAEDNAR